MIKLKVSAANIAVEEKETLTEGRVGLLCRFSFTGEWDGLAKTAVFDGADRRDVILTEDTVAVPAECLAAEGYSLSVGVYGKNAAGDIVIPTVYATVGKIQRSAYPSGKETAAPTPDVVAQIQQAAANAEAMARSVREDADLGKFNGGQGPQGPAGATGPKGDTGAAGEAGGYYTPAVTQPDENTLRVAFTPSKEGMPAVDPADIAIPTGGGSGTSGEDGGYYTPEVTQTSENTMQVAFTPSKTSMPAVSGKEITLPAGQKGDKGDAGAAGADGKSAYAYAVEGGYTGTEEEFAAKLAQEKFANPNALTFTGAVTGSYDGSEAVTVEIPSGGEDGEIVTADETVLASGTIATGTVANTYIDTGVTLAELRNWKHWTIEIKSTGQTTYWGVAFNKEKICRLQHSNIKFQIEWIDSAKTIARVFYAAGTGYEYGVDDIKSTVTNSSMPVTYKQGPYAKVLATDDKTLNIDMYNDLTVNALWRIKGVLKYGA